MEIIKPSYYDCFRCIAGECPDSCCREWSVAVDPDAAAKYRALPGELGDRLRQALKDEDGDTVMAIENGRCPMWRADGLCRIQAELNHDALCKTCREFPRLTHDYGDFQEWGLELSCPEAARLILSSSAQPWVRKEVPGGEPAEYDPIDMEILLNTRQAMLSLLENDRPVNEILAIALMYGYHAQGELDSGEHQDFDPDEALAEAREFGKNGDERLIMDFFKELEILSGDWENRLNTPEDSAWSEIHLRIFRYFVERYWLQAIDDLDLVGRVKLGIISCLVAKILGGDPIRTAQRYSKEIENDPENVDAILEGAYTSPAFTDEKLLDLLLNDQ